jgi:hypothetical protein
VLPSVPVGGGGSTKGLHTRHVGILYHSFAIGHISCAPIARQLRQHGREKSRRRS